jgi:hypothetical protein
LFKNSESYLFNGDSSFINENLNQLGQKVFNKQDLVLSENLRKVIQNPVKWNNTVNPATMIHLKYMPVYGKEAFVLAAKLKGSAFNGKKYQLAGVDSVSNISFNPLVKYFRDEDEGLAKNIAAQINKSDMAFFKNNPVTIQKLSVKAPVSQVEIWIGRYERKKWDQLFIESLKYKIAGEK